MTRELEAKYDKARSFYGKAVVEELDGVVRLYSYKSLVAQVYRISSDDWAVKIFSVYDDDGENLTFSNTTVRHLKEFLLQNGFEAVSKKQIMRDYEVVE